MWHRAVDGVARRVLRTLDLHPSRLGWRWVVGEHPRDWTARAGEGTYRELRPSTVHRVDLPRNVDRRDRLSDEERYWGLSFRDVPERRTDPTWIATLPDVRVVVHTDHQRNNRYFALLGRDGRRLAVPGESWRPEHAARLRDGGPVRRLERASWILQPSYMNFSIWLRAHLPKLQLLAEEGWAADVLFPSDDGFFPGRNTVAPGQDPLRDVLEETTRRLGLDPGAMPRLDAGGVYEVGELTLVGMDVYPVPWLQRVRDALAPTEGRRRGQRVYISRERSSRRRLANQAEVWPVLREHGFEKVLMEDLSLSEQIDLMAGASAVFSPHGAGLTHVMFCPPGTHVVEVVDPAYPCPNFYGLAAYLGHPYWLLEGEAVGERPAGRNPLRVDPAAVAHVLERLEASP